MLLIITATNSFITAPIASEFGIDHLIATEPEIINQQFTGRVSGIPCFQDGKVSRLESWCTQHNQNREGGWFYSDSHNDLPLLEIVDHPVAVDPDTILKKHAEDKGWPVISLSEK